MYSSSIIIGDVSLTFLILLCHGHTRVSCEYLNSTFNHAIYFSEWRWLRRFSSKNAKDRGCRESSFVIFWLPAFPRTPGFHHEGSLAASELPVWVEANDAVPTNRSGALHSSSASGPEGGVDFLSIFSLTYNHEWPMSAKIREDRWLREATDGSFVRNGKATRRVLFPCSVKLETVETAEFWLRYHIWRIKDLYFNFGAFWSPSIYGCHLLLERRLPNDLIVKLRYCSVAMGVLRYKSKVNIRFLFNRCIGTT